MPEPSLLSMTDLMSFFSFIPQPGRGEIVVKMLHDSREYSKTKAKPEKVLISSRTAGGAACGWLLGAQSVITQGWQQMLRSGRRAPLADPCLLSVQCHQIHLCAEPAWTQERPVATGGFIETLT